MRGALAAGLSLPVLAVLGVAVLVASVPRAEMAAQRELRIAHATLIEPGIGRRRDQTLTIRAGRIAAVRRSEPSEEPSPWDGHFVMPGLVDLHVHLPPPVMPAELRATLSGPVPGLKGLSYRLSANWVFGKRGPYVVGFSQGGVPGWSDVPELVPVDRFRTTVGLQYDFFQ